jgi:hypothetical protein
MTNKMIIKVDKTLGKRFGKAMACIGVGILLLYGCSGGSSGGGGGVTETNNSETVALTSTVDECLNQNLDISYDPNTLAPSASDTMVNLKCPAEKIALVVIGPNSSPASKNYYINRNATGGFNIPESVWDEVLEGAPKGSYDINIYLYNSGKVTSIPKAGKINLLNDYPPQD